MEQPEIDAWYHYWIHAGFEPLETMLRPGPYACGPRVTLADVCLVPQVLMARRFGIELAAFPRLLGVFEATMRLPQVAEATEARPAPLAACGGSAAR